MTDVSEVLETAADIIEKEGWIQNGFGHSRLGYCAVGAIARAEGFDFPTFAFEEPSEKALRSYLGVEWVPSWNDDPARTKQEVLDALRGAAKQERIKEENANV